MFTAFGNQDDMEHPPPLKKIRSNKLRNLKLASTMANLAPSAPPFTIMMRKPLQFEETALSIKKEGVSSKGHYASDLESNTSAEEDCEDKDGHETMEQNQGSSLPLYPTYNGQEVINSQAVSQSCNNDFCGSLPPKQRLTRHSVALEVWKALSRFMHRFGSCIKDFGVVTKDKEIMTVLAIRFSQAIQVFQAPAVLADRKGIKPTLVGNDRQLQWFLDQVLVEVLSDHIDSLLSKSLLDTQSTFDTNNAPRTTLTVYDRNWFPSSVMSSPPQPLPSTNPVPPSDQLSSLLSFYPLERMNSFTTNIDSQQPELSRSAVSSFVTPPEPDNTDLSEFLSLFVLDDDAWLSIEE